jgi:hypothetical protein
MIGHIDPLADSWFSSWHLDLIRSSKFNWNKIMRFRLLEVYIHS